MFVCMQCHYSCHTAITSHCHHTTLPANHNAFTQYITSRYLMRTARLLQAVMRFISGRATELCCCPSINRSRRFRFWASPSVNNSVFLHCHQDIWTIHNLYTRNNMTLYEQWNWKQIRKKKAKMSLCTTYRHIWGDDVYMHSFFTSATLETN